MERLCDCADRRWAELLVYIVGLGKPVTVRRHWDESKGKVKHLSPDAFVCHVSLAKSLPATFQLSDRFCRECAGVKTALEACAALPGSKWRVLVEGAPVDGAKNVLANDVFWHGSNLSWVQPPIPTHLPLLQIDNIISSI